MFFAFFTSEPQGPRFALELILQYGVSMSTRFLIIFPESYTYYDCFRFTYFCVPKTGFQAGILIDIFIDMLIDSCVGTWGGLSY